MSDRPGHLSRTKASGAHGYPSRTPIDHSPDFLEVRIPTAPRLKLGVADVVPG